jgi:D-alanine-D-alanine ligase-like ATP-grasp enzyme
VDESVSRRIKEYAKVIVTRLGCTGMARIDFFLDGCGNIYLNEINTIPGMTSGSLYPRLLARCGISTEEMLTELIEDALYAGNI